MQKINKTTCAMSLALIIVGGGGLIYAQNPFQRGATVKTAAKASDSKATDLTEIYRLQAQEAIKKGVPVTPTRAEASDEKEVMLEEDFSLLTDGTPDAPGAPLSSYTEDGNSFIPEGKLHTDGWWAIGAREAGGMVALAEPRIGGLITTKAMDLYGRVTVSFRLKSREGNPEGSRQTIIVSPIGGDAYDPVLLDNFKLIILAPEDGWQDYEITFLIADKSGTGRIQFNGMTYSAAGFLIDDIKITRDYELCLQPVGLNGYGFDNEGFTAAWTPNAENNSFLLSLLQEKTVGKEDVVGTVDFESSLDNIAAPARLTLSDKATVAAGEGADKSNALRLANGEWAELECGGGLLYGLSFFYNSSVDEYDGDGPYLKIEGYTLDGYQEYGDISLLDLEEGGESVDLKDYPTFLNTYSKVRLSVSGLEEGDYCLLDNIAYEALPETEISEILKNEPVKETSYRVDGLDPEAEYYFAVEGVKRDDLTSGRTAYYHALGLPAPVATEATDVEKRGAYTANWEATPKAKWYEVANFESRTIGEAVKDYVILHDDFEKAKDSESYLEGTSFDEFTKTPGWTSANGLVSLGSIGTFRVPIYTPELSLGNNDGRFTVNMKILAFPDEIVVVQSMEEYVVTDLWDLYSDCDPYSLIEHEMTLTFSDGADYERLAIYGLGNGKILIDEITITQDVKEGDMVNSYVGREITEGDELSVRFSGLTNTPEFDYIYKVKAMGDYFGTKYTSDNSNDIKVSLNLSGVEEILKEIGELRGIRVVEGGIEVTLAEAAAVSVSSLSGVNVCNETLSEGTHRIALDGGIYVVTAGGKTIKAIVK